MEEKLVEIKSYSGEGYQSLVYFESWRVAILNDCPSLYRPGTIKTLERHMLTDEVFVLLSGECTLLIGGDRQQPGQIQGLPMEPLKLYNVKKGVWHNLIGNPGMSLLIVENADTAKENSEYFNVTEDMLPHGDCASAR